MNRSERRIATQLRRWRRRMKEWIWSKTLFSYNPFYRLPISGKSEMIARGWRNRSFFKIMWMKFADLQIKFYITQDTYFNNDIFRFDLYFMSKSVSLRCFLCSTWTVFDTIIFTRLHVFAGINFKRDNKKVFTGGKHISSSNLFESFAALHCRGEKPEKTFKKFNAEHAIYCW